MKSNCDNDGCLTSKIYILGVIIHVLEMMGKKNLPDYFLDIYESSFLTLYYLKIFSIYCTMLSYYHANLQITSYIDHNLYYYYHNSII